MKTTRKPVFVNLPHPGSITIQTSDCCYITTFYYLLDLSAGGAERLSCVDALSYELNRTEGETTVGSLNGAAAAHYLNQQRRTAAGLPARVAFPSAVWPFGSGG